MAAGHFVLGDFTLFVVCRLCWCSWFGFLDDWSATYLSLLLGDLAYRRTFTVVLASELCYCASLPIRGGAESDL